MSSNNISSSNFQSIDNTIDLTNCAAIDNKSNSAFPHNSSFSNASNISSIDNHPSSPNNNQYSKSPSNTNFNSIHNSQFDIDERKTSIRTQQLNSLNEGKGHMVRNNSTRSFGGRIAGRNPLYSQSSLPVKYEFETPGQAVQQINSYPPLSNNNNKIASNPSLNNTTDQSYNQISNSTFQKNNPNFSNNNDSFNNNSHNSSNGNSQQRSKLVYQPRSNDSDNAPSIYLNDTRSTDVRSIKDDDLSVAEKFKSNYEKFLEISKSIDFEEKLINLQLNKSKLKASARTSALLAGFAMVAYVELSFDDNDDEVNALNDANNYNQINGHNSPNSPNYNSVTIVPEFLIILFSICTSLLVSVNILALMISTCLLPFIESISNSYNWLNDNDFQYLNEEFYELADNLRALSGKVSVLEAENGKNVDPKICIIVDEYGNLGKDKEKSNPNNEQTEENNNLILENTKPHPHSLTDQQINQIEEDLNYLNISNYKQNSKLKLMNSSYRSLLSKAKSLELNRSNLSLSSNMRLGQAKPSHKTTAKQNVKYDLKPLIESSRRRSLREFTNKTLSSRDKYLEEHLNNLKKHERINFFIEIAWKFSNVYGVFLFLIEIIILGWVKFWEIGFPSGVPGKKAAFASTLVILPFLFIFVWFIVYFYKNFILVNFFSNFNLIRNINEFHNYKLIRTTSTGSLQSMA